MCRGLWVTEGTIEVPELSLFQLKAPMGYQLPLENLRFSREQRVVKRSDALPWGQAAGDDR